jgi:uncharacterized Zn finger protein
MDLSLDNFESIVDATVLARGIEYWKTDTIVELEVLEGKDYNALVIGREIYAVNIVLDRKGVLFTHNCNCPYNHSSICKHKVAVMLAIRSNLKDGIPIKKGSLSVLKKTLEQYKKEELLQVLITLAKSNLKFRKEIMNSLGIKLNTDE